MYKELVKCINNKTNPNEIISSSLNAESSSTNIGAVVSGILFGIVAITALLFGLLKLISYAKSVGYQNSISKLTFKSNSISAKQVSNKKSENKEQAGVSSSRVGHLPNIFKMN